MINTIFYFPSSLQQYDADASNLNARTISFVPPTGDGGTGQIYKNGIPYGKMTTLDIKNEIKLIMELDRYTLPIATAEKLGGIMVGDGLAINSENGKLDINLEGLQFVPGLKELVETIIKTPDTTKASKTQFGVVKVGDGIAVNEGTISVSFADTPINNNMKASTTQFGVVKIKANGGLSVADGVIGLDTLNLPESEYNRLRGPKGDAFKYSDFTAEQLAALKGAPFTYADFTQEQLNSLKGAPGITPNCSAAAQVNNTTGTPSVTVHRSGSDANPLFTFIFSGLKGEQGNPGNDANTTAINNSLNDLSDRINTEKGRIDAFIRDLDANIKDEIEDLFDKAEWVQQHFPGGSGGYSNFGLSWEDVTNYLQTLGLWETSDSNTTTMWSTIKQDVNNIKISVQQLQANQGTGGQVDYQALSGALYTYLTGDTITSGLQSTWAKFLALDNNEIQMLEWMAAGARAQANSSSAVADLFAAAKNYQTNQTAYAGLNTRVQTIENSYVSSTNLSSAVNNSVSSIFTQNSSNQAVAGLFADASAGKRAKEIVDGDALNKYGAAIVLSSDFSTYFDNNVSRITLQASQINNIGQVLQNTLANGIGSGANTVIINNGIVNATKINTGLVYDDGELFINCGSGETIHISPIYGDGGTLKIGGDKRTSSSDSDFAWTNIKVKAATVTINATTFNGSVAYTGSDETLKNIIKDVDVSVEDLSNIRIVDYEFKSNLGDIHSGTIAQDWLNVLPNVVREMDEDKHLALDYESAALISAIVDAREIVALKQENAELKARLAAIEERLGL